MNERIQELSKQADQYADSLGLSGAEWCDAQNQKFVELVIQKCVRIVEDSPWNLQRGYKPVDQAALIKAHFGVDE